MKADVNSLKAVSRKESHSTFTRDFFWVASVSTALAFGCGVASLQALQWDKSGVSFQVSAWTFLAFAIGAAVAWIFWRLVQRNVLTMRSISWLLPIVGIGLFLYPVRFVPQEKRADVITGLGIAVVALSGIGWLLWRTMRFFDDDASDVVNRPDKELFDD